jgi:hypothetical protein
MGKATHEAMVGPPTVCAETERKKDATKEKINASVMAKRKTMGRRKMIDGGFKKVLGL